MTEKFKKNNQKVLEAFFTFPDGIENVDEWKPTEEEKRALILYDPELEILSSALSSHAEFVLADLERLEKELGNPSLSRTQTSQLRTEIATKQRDLRATLTHLSLVIKKHAFVHEHLLVTNGKADEMTDKFKQIKRVLSNESIAESPESEENKPLLGGETEDEKRLLKPGASRIFRQIFIEVNWWRLFLIRIRRVGDAFALIANTPMGDPEINKALSYLGWVFYVPRVAVNLFWFFQHWLLPLSDEERKIPSWLRLQTQFKRRWAELSNDVVWMVVGLVNCFYLTGLSAMGLTTALYFFDVLVAGIRYYVERERHRKIEEAIRLIKSMPGVDLEEVARLEQLLSIVHGQLIEKRRMLMMSLATASILAICTSLFFFSMLGVPWLAPVAASLILLTCIMTKLVLEPHFKNERPLKDIILAASLTTVGASLIAAGIFMASGLLAATAMAGPLAIAAGVLIVIGASILSYYLNTSKAQPQKKTEPLNKTRSFEELMDGCERSIGSRSSSEHLSVLGLFSPPSSIAGSSPSSSPENGQAANDNQQKEIELTRVPSLERQISF